MLLEKKSEISFPFQQGELSPLVLICICPYTCTQIGHEPTMSAWSVLFFSPILHFSEMAQKEAAI